MIIQCVSCGYSKFHNPRGTAEELEQRINDTITEGWRYSPNYKGYVCPKCCKEGIQDGFFAMVVEPIRKSSKSNSYKKLMVDFVRFINELHDLDMRWQIKEQKNE